MTVIQHRRHSWRAPDGEHLIQAGVDLARRVGESMGHFDLVITSNFPRAFETALAMGYAVDAQEPLLSNIGPGVEAELDWTKGCTEFARAYHLDGATRQACERQAAFLKTIASSLRPDGRALVVSHGGIIEEGVVGLLPDLDYSHWGASCERCEGVSLVFQGTTCTSVSILRLPT